MADVPSIPKLINESPQAAALVSKLNTSQSANTRPYTEYNYEQVALGTLSRIQNNDSILKLLPDLELCVQIYVSCILDPNGTVGSKLTLQPPKVNMLQSVRSSITETIAEYIDKNYKLNSKLSRILREALFTKGAYVEAIIPEASVDRLINRSSNYLGVNNAINTEGYSDFSDQMAPKVLGAEKEYVVPLRAFTKKYFTTKGRTDAEIERDLKKFTTSLNSRIKNINNESSVVFSMADIGDYVSITDDYTILFNPRNKVNESINKYSVSHEARVDKQSKNKGNKDKSSYNYLDTLFRNNGGMGVSQVEFALNEDETIRDSVAKPMVLRLPVESVIPVYVTNNPEMHVGYFVLLDENGNPLNLEKDNPALDVCNHQYANTRDPKTNMINMARHGLHGAIKNVPEIRNIDELYSDIVDHMIKSKLRNSDFESLVELEDTAEIYRVMLARALSAKMTRLLYLPKELVQYYAFDYRNNGTGKSLLEDTLVLASMAGMLLYANVKSSIQNTVPITDITLSIDEDDPNPLGTAEKYLSETIRANNINFPLGMTDPTYLHDWAIRSGFRLKVESPFLPKLDVDRSVSTGINGDILDSSQDVYRTIIGMIIKSLGMSPEIVESAMKEEFAASVVAKNKLLAKRIMMFQQQFIDMITEHVRLIIRNDVILRDLIRSAVSSNKAEIKKGIKTYLKINDAELQDIELNKIKNSDLEEYLLDVFTEGIQADLPSPDTSGEDEKLEILNAVKSRIETVADILYADSTFLDATLGTTEVDVSKIKGMVVSGYMRKWIIDNNMTPELVDWYKKSDDNTLKEPYFDDIKDFAAGVMKEYNKYLERTDKELKDIGKEILKYKNRLEELAGGSSDVSDTSGSSDSGGENENVSEDGEDQFDMGDEGEEGEGGEETPQFEDENAGADQGGDQNQQGSGGNEEVPQFEG